MATQYLHAGAIYKELVDERTAAFPVNLLGTTRKGLDQMFTRVAYIPPPGLTIQGKLKSIQLICFVLLLCLSGRHRHFPLFFGSLRPMLSAEPSAVFPILTNR